MEANILSPCNFAHEKIERRSPLVSTLVKTVQSGRNADGRIEVFYIGIDDVVYHNWQLAPNGKWIGESTL